MKDQQVIRRPSPLAWDSSATIWCCLLLAWFVFLCVVPDPRPLAAPEAAVRSLRGTIGLSDPAARAAATIILRAAGLGLIGVFASLFCASIFRRWSGLCGLLVATLLALLSLWINLGYFPIAKQLQFASACVIAGVLLGMAMRRSWIASGALVVFAVSLFVWGTWTRIPDDLDTATRLTGLHLLEHADGVPSGDEGFTELLQIAFSYAEDNSHGRDAVGPNRAAILAMGVILGETRIAAVARRKIDGDLMGDYRSLRARVTLRGRNDLSRHFWVSGALKVLTDENRSMAVGLTKELMDAQPGGSGFSFADKAANMAGIRFAELATTNSESAHQLQRRIIDGMTGDDFCPDVRGLPEGRSGLRPSLQPPPLAPAERSRDGAPRGAGRTDEAGAEVAPVRVVDRRRPDGLGLRL